jgi:hypothetical protein
VVPKQERRVLGDVCAANGLPKNILMLACGWVEAGHGSSSTSGKGGNSFRGLPLKSYSHVGTTLFRARVPWNSCVADFHMRLKYGCFPFDGFPWKHTCAEFHRRPPSVICVGKGTRLLSLPGTVCNSPAGEGWKLQMGSFHSPLK